MHECGPGPGTIYKAQPRRDRKKRPLPNPFPCQKIKACDQSSRPFFRVEIKASEEWFFRHRRAVTVPFKSTKYYFIAYETTKGNKLEIYKTIERGLLT